MGKGGNIAFNSDEGNIALDNGSLSSSSASNDAGDVTFLAQNNITFTSVSTIESVGLLGGNINLTSNDGIISIDDSDIESITTDSGIGGDINLSAESISLTNNAIALTSTVGPNGGRGGNLIADASDSVMLLDGGQFTSNTLGTGKAGDLTISTRQLVIQNSQPGSNLMTGAGSGTLEGSSGQGGNLTINASESVEIIGNEPGAFNPDLGQPGTVINLADISTGLTTATAGSGDAGNLTINTKQLMIRDGAGASSGNTDTSTGNGGRLTVNASQSLDLQGKAGLTTATLGSGDAGELVVTTGRMMLQDGALIGTDTLASGNAGDLKIKTAELFLGNGSRIGAATTNEGSGATVTVNSSESVEVVGTSTDGSVPSGIFTNSEGSGNAGNLEIETRRLVVRDGGRISASTSGTGKAGNLLVNNSDSVEIIGISADGKTASSLSFDSSGAGDAGELEIETRRLLVSDGGRVSGSTSGTGKAGNLLVSNSDSVEIIGSSADGKTASSLFFDSSSSGNAGELIIDTNRFVVREGGQVSAATSGDGRGGLLEVNATESVEVIGTSADGKTASSLFFDSSGAGDAGELIIDTSRFIVQDGGQVSAATSGEGRGGLLEVNATESVEINGTSADNQFASGLFFDSRGAGDARGITINTGELTVQNGGQVTVSGSGTGISGDLEVTADSIFLTNQGSLGATTAAAEGGNIRLQVTDSIILRHDSEIVAEAFGTANGGNITIDAGGFVLAVLSENSDVVANAFEGRGGNIFAKAAGIFGFRQFQDRRTPESDFTASSELGIDGMVELIVEDNLTIIPLPDDFLGDSVVRGCPAMARELAPNEFITTGTGGVPTHPAHLSSSEAIDVGLVQPAPPTQINSESYPSSATAQNPANSVPETIVEAQDWVINADGIVELVAYVPVATFGSSGLSASCNLQ
ncbi:MAG: S-layer family protein [Symploca sp. SIO1A3]|nr:S-layer family protein [Symploca sp. SIO1A3]